MGLLAIRFDDEDSGTYAFGKGVDIEFAVRNRGGEHVTHCDRLRLAGATSLKHAMRKAEDDEPLYVCDGDYGDLGYDWPQVSPVRFESTVESLLVAFDFVVDDYEDDDEALHRHFGELLAPLLTRGRCRLASITMHPNVSTPPWVATATLAPSTHGRSASEVFAVGVDAELLLSAATTGGLTRTTTVDLLRSGHGAILLGQKEGPWLDVKACDYDLSRGTERGKISLAQDVARFANGEEGGVIAIGFATRKANGSETISKVTPLPPLAKGTAQHAKAIDHRVFPPVDGLTIEEVPVDGGAIVIIHVPPQPEESKPFLVHGAIVNGRVEGAFISIVRRRGEDSIPITAQSIHSTLAAGRALLRRGAITDGDGHTRAGG